MIWGAITSQGIGILLPVQGNIRSANYCQILQHGLLPVIDWFYHDGGYTFIHDNAPVHASAKTRAWIDERDIRVSEWPPQSPDLNIIENIWRTMKLRLQEVAPTIESRGELVSNLQRIWWTIKNEEISSLYSSLPRRMRAVLRSLGKITKY